MFDLGCRGSEVAIFHVFCQLSGHIILPSSYGIVEKLSQLLSHIKAVLFNALFELAIAEGGHLFGYEGLGFGLLENLANGHRIYPHFLGNLLIGKPSCG